MKYVTFLIGALFAICSTFVSCATAPNITSNPPKDPVSPGDIYSYSIDAKGSKPITFKKIKGPEKLKVDKQEGHVKWSTDETTTPDKYKTAISAVNNAGKDEQQWTITVTRGDKFETGKKLGIRLWKEEFGMTNVIKALVNKKENFLQSKSLKEGMMVGYMKGVKNGKVRNVNGKEKAKKIINTILKAGAEKRSFQNGKKIGAKLIKRDVLVSEAANRKRKSVLEGKGYQLAWRTGFIVGYSEGDEKLKKGAISLYKGLGK